MRNDRQAKIAVVNAKVAAMTEAKKEARVQEIYAISADQLTEEDTAEFFAIMFGGYSPSPCSGITAVQSTDP
jgi:hypothetical protein